MHVLLDIERVFSFVDPFNLVQCLDDRLDAEGGDGFAKADDSIRGREFQEDRVAGPRSAAGRGVFA